MEKITADEPATPTTTVAAQETPAIEPASSRLREVFVKHNPDVEFPNMDEQEFFVGDYEQKCTRLAEMMADNEKVANAIMSEPTLASIIGDVVEGVPFEVALAKNIDVEAIQPMKDEPNFKEFEQAVKDRRSRQEQIQTQRKTIEANLEIARQTADEFFTEEGVEEDDRDKFVDFIDAMILEVLNGNFSKSSLKKMLQAYRYEDDLSAATTQGEVNGRNAAIETKRATNSSTDGLPEAGGGVGAEIPIEPNDDVISQIVNRSSSRKRF